MRSKILLYMMIVWLMVNTAIAQNPSWNFPAENAPAFESVLETEMQESPKKPLRSALKGAKQGTSAQKKQVSFAEEEIQQDVPKQKIIKQEPKIFFGSMGQEEIAIKEANIAKKNIYDLTYKLYKFTSPSSVKLEYQGQPTKKEVDEVMQAITKYVANPALSQEDKTLVQNTIRNLNIALDQNDAPTFTAQLNALGKLINFGKKILISIKKIVTAVTKTIAAKKSQITQSFSSEAQLEKAIAAQKAELQKQQEERERSIEESRAQRLRQEQAQEKIKQQLQEQEAMQHQQEESYRQGER